MPLYKKARDEATLPDEQDFWHSLMIRLEYWCKSDDLRTQFRLCEFSKVATIICRNQGRKRQQVPEQAIGEFDSDGECEVFNDDGPRNRKRPEPKTLPQLREELRDLERGKSKSCKVRRIASGPSGGVYGNID